MTSLVLAVQQGDRQAADDLYTEVHQGLYYYISKTVNDPELAQDLLQETFMEIYHILNVSCGYIFLLTCFKSVSQASLPL